MTIRSNFGMKYETFDKIEGGGQAERLALYFCMHVTDVADRYECGSKEAGVDGAEDVVSWSGILPRWDLGRYQNSQSPGQHLHSVQLRS